VGYTQYPGAYLFTLVTVALQVKNWINDASEITIQLKIVSEAANFITWILAFLAYGGSSFVKILN
jgi:hypothetical protein